MTRIFLNVDAGELADEPDELYAVAHAVSIACGGHAGDAESMRRVLRACARAGTMAGAHPSYEDREGFGRRALAIGAEALEESVRAQCAALAAIASELGVPVAHVKPHGALYHAANAELELARAVVRGAMRALYTHGAPAASVRMIGPPRGMLVRASEEAGLAYAREGFADRATRADGTLVPRGEPGAVLTDVAEVTARARALAAGGAIDTLCVHGDSPGALVLARAVRAELDGLA